jgi:hypothetical protein
MALAAAALIALAATPACRARSAAGHGGGGGTARPAGRPGPASLPASLPEDPVAGRKATEQWRQHLLHEEHERRMRYDKLRLRQHRAVFKLLKEARARYERARTTAAVDTIRPQVAALLEDVQGHIAAIDRWADSSYFLEDYDAALAILTDPYPQAKIAALKGDAAALAKLRAALDAHSSKIAERLVEVENENENEEASE